MATKDTVSLKGKVGKAKNKELARKDRKVEIAKMYVKGFSQAEICSYFKLQQSSISNLLKQIREEWLESIVADYGETKAREIAKIDHMETVAWEAWERSCKDSTQETKKIQSALQSLEEDAENAEGEYISVRKSIMTPIREHFETVKKGRDGNPAFLDRVSWCIEVRLKLFGILKEDKREVNQTINFNFDSLVGEPDDADDPIEQRILEVQSLPSHTPSTNGTNGDTHG